MHMPYHKAGPLYDFQDAHMLHDTMTLDISAETSDFSGHRCLDA